MLKVLIVHPTLCDPMDCSMPGFPILHYLPVCSNSCPLSPWWQLTISSSVVPFSCPQSFPASGSFQWASSLEKFLLKNTFLRKMAMITLYARQQRRHRCTEESFGLWGRGRGWDDLGGWHLNMYIIICKTNHQPRFDVRYMVLRAGALGWPWGMGWGGKRVGGSGWGTHVHPWRIHVNVWQNHYIIVK